MAGNNLDVAITADVTDLTAKMAVARNQYTETQATLRQLAAAEREAIAAGTPMSDAFQQAATNAARAKAQVESLKTQLSQASSPMDQLGHAANNAHSGFSGIAREARALFDELSSGRVKQAPGTALLLAQNIYSVAPAALGAIAGIGALAVGIGVLIERAVAAQAALDSAFAGSRWAGNLDLTRSAISELTQAFERTAHLSASDAQAAITAWARVPGMTAPVIQGLSTLWTQYAEQTGEDAEKARTSLAKLFDKSTSAEDMAKGFVNLTQAQRAEASAADRTGNVYAIAAEKLQLLRDQLAVGAADIDKNKDALLAQAAAASAGTSAEAQMGDVVADVLRSQNAQRAQQVQLLDQQIAKLREMQSTPQQTLQLGMQVAQGENPMALQVQQAQTKVTELTAALEVAKKAGDQVDVTILASSLQKVQESLDNLQIGPVLESMRQKIEQVAATWDGSQSGMLAKQIQIAQQTLASFQGSAQQRLQITSEVARLEIEQRRVVGEQSIAAAREEIAQESAATQQGAAERLAAEASVWNRVLSQDRLTAAQRVEVQRSLDQALTQLAQQRGNEQRQIAQITTQGEIAIARADLEAKKQALDEEVAAHQITAEQRLTQARDLTQRESALVIQGLQQELDAAQGQPVQQARINEQILEQKARLNTELATLDRQYQTQAAAAARQQVTAWEGAVSAIEGAESGFISTLISGRKTLGQSLGQLALQLAEREITADLRAVTTRLLMHQSAAATQKALEQGGFVYHLLVEGQKTGASAAQNAARTAASTTAATAQTAAVASATAAQQGIQAATGAPLVMADAAKAFAGSFASAAQIPFVGWAMAPGVAAAAFAEVSAMAPLASFAVGAWDLPHDMVAQLHEGEMVVPRTYAQGMRDSADGRGDGSAGTSTHHNYNGPVNVRAFDAKGVGRLLSRASTRGALVAAAGRHVRRGGRF